MEKEILKKIEIGEETKGIYDHNLSIKKLSQLLASYEKRIRDLEKFTNDIGSNLRWHISKEPTPQKECEKCGGKMVMAHTMSFTKPTGFEHIEKEELICPKCLEDDNPQKTDWEKTMKEIWKKIKLFLGIISPCCEAKLYYNEKWNAFYCSKCHKKI